MDKEHKDPDTIDLEAPRFSRYMHTAWKKHQNTVYWFDITIAQKKVLSNSIGRHRSIQYTPSLLFPESRSDGN